MTCETEFNDNLKVYKKYQILKITVVDKQYFITIQFSCSNIPETVHWLFCIFFFYCEMQGMSSVVFTMSRAFSDLCRHL